MKAATEVNRIVALSQFSKVSIGMKIAYDIANKTFIKIPEIAVLAQ